MNRAFLRQIIARQRTLVLREAEQLQGFMALLMKRRNAQGPWTREEIALLKAHVRRLSLYLPALVLFALPGGSLLLPLLAWTLDRRRRRRLPPAGACPR